MNHIDTQDRGELFACAFFRFAFAFSNRQWLVPVTPPSDLSSKQISWRLVE
jgi:hypothetical protein